MKKSFPKEGEQNCYTWSCRKGFCTPVVVDVSGVVSVVVTSVVVIVEEPKKQTYMHSCQTNNQLCIHRSIIWPYNLLLNKMP